MNEQALIEELLARGLTEQEIIDLVAREVLKKNPTAMRDNQQLPESPPAFATPNSDASALVRPQSTPAEVAPAENVPLDHRSTLDTDEAGRKRDAATILHEFLEVYESRFIGPLPPPDVCRQYEALAPGITERLLRMHERDQEATHGSIVANDRRLDRGQTYALIFCALALATAMVFAALGSAKAGASIAIAVIVPVVSAFSTDSIKTPKGASSWSGRGKATNRSAPWTTTPMSPRRSASS